MPTERTFVIAGAGLAGAKAAETLRLEGYDEHLVVLGAEAHRPYDRPALSKGYLVGDKDREKLFVHDEGFYADHDMDLRTSSPAVAIEGDTIVLEDGGRIGFDRLLLATGARPRRLGVPGSELEGVHHLRALDDSDAIATSMEAGGHMVVVGGGWIGAEVAAAARHKGLEVTIIQRSSVLLQSALGPEVGRAFHRAHQDEGVQILSGARVRALEGGPSVTRVVTEDGRAVECDVVVVGVGAEPNTAVAERSGLAIDDGVVVDQYLRTAREDIFAAGDVANAWHPFIARRLRLEHWSAALNQGPVAARNMMGAGLSYERLPFFFSDQYDLGMEYAGLHRPGDQVVFRGDPARREFVSLWLEDSRVVAGMHVNVWGAIDPIQDLIRSGQPVDVAVLGDPDVPLQDLVPADHRQEET
jgi:3-phenylpropionate/trans-cinnamate dioxygenase ferredoxin reductase component